MARQQKDSTIDSMKAPKFSVVDFEFAMIRNLMFLVSGAIVQSDSEDSDGTKFQGIPIELKEDGNTMTMSRKQGHETLKTFKKIMIKKKPEQYEAFKREMENGFKQIRGNLTKTIISRYFKFENENNIVVVWNGNVDKVILNRLGIRNRVVNLEAYDIFNNGRFFLRLINIDTKCLIAEAYIGCLQKNGRLLSLKDAHNMVCSTEHPAITYVHDPLSDVILTKCLFNVLVNQETYEKLLTKTLELV